MSFLPGIDYGHYSERKSTSLVPETSRLTTTDTTQHIKEREREREVP